MNKTPFKGNVECAHDLLNLIHKYVYGPLSISIKYYHFNFITFIDDYSRYDYVYLMKYKNKAFEMLK